MTILDRANAFIGHEQEIDEGYETTMRRNAFIAGFKEALELVKRMRDAQEELDTCSIGDYAFRQHCAAQLESEVDEYLKEMEEDK